MDYPKPTETEVYGHKIKIVFVEAGSLGEDSYGEFDSVEMCIRLVDHPGWRRILQHERAHGMLRFSGLHNLLSDDLQEAIVEAIEYGLFSHYA